MGKLLKKDLDGKLYSFKSEVKFIHIKRRLRWYTKTLYHFCLSEDVSEHLRTFMENHRERKD